MDWTIVIMMESQETRRDGENSVELAISSNSDDDGHRAM